MNIYITISLLGLGLGSDITGHTQQGKSDEMAAQANVVANNKIKKCAEGFLKSFQYRAEDEDCALVSS